MEVFEKMPRKMKILYIASELREMESPVDTINILAKAFGESKRKKRKGRR